MVFAQACQLNVIYYYYTVLIDITLRQEAAWLLATQSKISFLYLTGTNFEAGKN